MLQLHLLNPKEKKWIKYSFVCPDCDSLIEYTCNEFDFPSGSVMDITCVCGGNATLMSVVNATIIPTNKKEEQMETMTDTFMQEQINELKTKLANHQNCDYWKSENGRVQSQIIELIHSSYAEETEASEILVSLAEIIDYNPVKEIQFTATIRFTGRIDVPLVDIDDFDLTDALSDAYVDINNGDIVIDSYDIEEVDEA